MQCFEAIEFVGKCVELFKNGLPHIPQNAVLARRNALVRILSVLALAHTSSARLLKNGRECNSTLALNNILLQKLGTRLMQAGAFSRPRRHKSHPDYPIISARVPR